MHAIDAAAKEILDAAARGLNLTVPWNRIKVTSVGTPEELAKACQDLHMQLFPNWTPLSSGEANTLAKFRGAWMATCPGEIFVIEELQGDKIEGHITPTTAIALAHEISHILVAVGTPGGKRQARQDLLVTRDSNDIPWALGGRRNWETEWAPRYLPVSPAAFDAFAIDRNEAVTHFVTQIVVHEWATMVDEKSREELLESLNDYNEELAGTQYTSVLDSLKDNGLTTDLYSDNKFRRAVGKSAGDILVNDFPGDRPCLTMLIGMYPLMFAGALLEEEVLSLRGPKTLEQNS